MENPKTLEEVLKIIEDWKCCLHCKYFYSWTATMEMCMFPDGQPLERAIRYETHPANYDGVCEKFEMNEIRR